MKRCLLIAIAVLAAPAPAGAQVPKPDDDPFYTVPAGLRGVPNGTILDSRPITAHALVLPLPVDAWQVKYKTRENQGWPTATVTTVMVPKVPWLGPGQRPLLSHQTAEDGVGTKCAPSYALRAGLLGSGLNNSQAETSAMTIALLQGWAVAAPDYQGPESQFLGNYMEARGVLDGIRAARAFEPATIDAKAPVALFGYSGGAVASAVAAQLHPSYAPELELAGVAMGGVVASYKSVLKAFDSSRYSGAIIVGVIGLDRSYPEAKLRQYLNERGKAAYAASQEDCLSDASNRHRGVRADDWTVRPNVIDEPRLSRFLRRVSPLAFADAPRVPVHEFHATDDELALIGPARRLIARYCAGGTAVQHEELPGDHAGGIAIGAAGAIAYLHDRFAGRPAPSNCPPGSVPEPRVRYSLSVRPATVRAGERTRFRFTARRKSGGRARPVARATVRFAGHRARTKRTGRAVITTALRHPGSRRGARLIVDGEIVASASVRCAGGSAERRPAAVGRRPEPCPLHIGRLTIRVARSPGPRCQ